MKNHPWVLGILAVTASVLVASCSSPQFRPFDNPHSKLCNSPAASCDVAVTVTCPGDVAKACWISVDPDLVLLSKSNGANKINWRLPDGGPFEFTADGLSFETDFGCMKQGPFMFACNSTTAAAFMAYKYTVKAMPRTGSRPVDALDPWVVTN